MTPQTFQNRFKAAQPEVPPDLGIRLGVFTPFPPEKVRSLPICPDDQAILFGGLPEDATPYLNFAGGSGIALQALSEVWRQDDANLGNFRILGNNSAGDYICVDVRDGRVVYHNHDSHMAEVFINSSIQKFAESLCLFAEAHLSEYTTPFLAELAAIDPPAAQRGSMWPAEYEMMSETKA